MLEKHICALCKSSVEKQEYLLLNSNPCGKWRILLYLQDLTHLNKTPTPINYSAVQISLLLCQSAAISTSQRNNGITRDLNMEMSSSYTVSLLHS